jgi:hypothetical protein
MPNETQNAIDWALTQEVIYPWAQVQVTENTPSELVDKVREYFNTHAITYSTFSYDDLRPYL